MVKPDPAAITELKRLQQLLQLALLTAQPFSHILLKVSQRRNRWAHQLWAEHQFLPGLSVMRTRAIA